MRKIWICLTVFILIGVMLITPVSADSTSTQYTFNYNATDRMDANPTAYVYEFVPWEINEVTFNVPQAPTSVTSFNPMQDAPFGNWLTNESGNAAIEPWEIVLSLIQPYTKIFGKWFFLIIYALYMWSVYARSRGTELMLVALGLSSTFYITLLPEESMIFVPILFGICLAAILFRLLKKR